MILRWKDPTASTHALTEIVRFSIEIIGKFAKFEIYFAWKLLAEAEDVPEFFLPIIKPSPDSLTIVRSMAWDLAMFRMAELEATMQRQEGAKKADVFIPLVASYDRRFKTLVDACPLKAIVIDPIGKQVNSIFRDELSFQLHVNAAIDNDTLSRLANPASQLKRHAAELNVPRIRHSISELELEVLRLSSN